MSVRDEIIQFINGQNILSVPVTESTHLYQDLHMDSLAFVSLLMDLEERFDITISLQEMENCLVVGELFLLVENKVREKL
ncbi:acyl carrier protein [Luxibacter massiliensis]|uniref:acyl carrier protein n=1 Tax=Luxibacter massiliensis TaxID=2219695 RepID=UPI000F0464BB|nr:acyl carrier protein [Luxibacter massiliensis]